MSYPLVSVIIPTYKRTDYLKLTLESIQNQFFQDFEIIVVDDGTPGDENQKLCATFDKVQYIKIPNSGGPATPRNEGIKLSKGKYLAFVDDDDIWLPNKLEVQVNILENNPDFGLVHGCCEVIDEKGVLQNRIIGRPGTPDVKHGDVSLRMMGNWTVMMPTPLVRKEVIQENGFFSETIPAGLEDVEYWTRCGFETKFYYFDKPLVEYRVHSDNLSADKTKYIELQLYLKQILNEKYLLGRINKKDFNKLLNYLCHAQIKMVKGNLFVVLRNLFLLDRFWIFGVNNCKMLVYILFFKK